MKLIPALRIGTQSALLILPLFLFLSWVSAAMSLGAIQDELLWGFEQEALSLAISTAAFLDADSIEPLAAGEETARQPLLILRQHDQLRTLAVLDPEGRALTPLIGDEEKPVPENPELARADARPRLGELFERDGERFLPAFAPIVADLDTGLPAGTEASGTDAETTGAPGEPAINGPALDALAPDGPATDGVTTDGVTTDGANKNGATAEGLAAQEAIAWVRVETGIEDYFAQLADFRRRATLQVIAPVALGTLVVVLLTSLIAPRIRQLTGAARGVRQGRYGERLRGSTVSEINDLVGTFRTMTSVLGESVDKARRTVVDHEQFRTWDDVAGAWIREALPGPTLEVGELRLATALGPDASNHRCLCLAPLKSPIQSSRVESSRGELSRDQPSKENPDSAGWLALLGELRGEDPRDLAARAVGVGFFLEQHVHHRSPEQLADDLQTSFDLERGHLLLRAGPDEPVLSIGIEYDGSLDVRTLELDSPHVFATGDAIDRQMIDALVELRGSAPPRDLLEDVSRLLPELRKEAVLVIAKTSDK